MIQAFTVAGFGEDTVVESARGDHYPVPPEGLEVHWVGGDCVLPDGTSLAPGTGQNLHLFRQPAPEGSDDPDWIGHKFEAVTTSSGLLGRYFLVPPAPQLRSRG